jgi:hypothetical protein
MVSRILQAAESSSRIMSRLRRRSSGQDGSGSDSARAGLPEQSGGSPMPAGGAALVLDDVTAVGAGCPSPSFGARSAASPSSGASVGSVGSSKTALSLSTASTSERCECEHHSHAHTGPHSQHAHAHAGLQSQHSHAHARPHSQHAHAHARAQVPHAPTAAPVPAPAPAPAPAPVSHGECDDSEEDRAEGGSLDAKIQKRRSMRDAKTASGMSQQDLRATIREVQMDSSLSATEKSKKVQEIMSFSWKQSQQDVRPKRSGSTTSASFKRRAGSASAVGVGGAGAGIGTGTGTGSSSSSNMHNSNQEGSGRSRRSASSRTARMAEVDAAALSGVDYVSVEDDFEDDMDLGDGEAEGEGDVEMDSGSQGAACETETESESETVVTYHDRAAGVLGCEHYERKCHVSAPCCNEFFGCRFCHDEAQDHAIDRYSIDRVRCMACGLAQPFAAQCSGCSTQFARYHCDVCRFFDDKENKKIYHCDKCKICRIGEGLGADYFHCDRCNACMSITLRDHKCVERSLESDCPVCSEYLFTSTTPVMFLVCGHCIHVKCYEHYTQTNFTCPLCCKSLGDMSQYFNRIDQMLAFERMPDEYQGWRSLIFCSDCEQRSTVPYHYVYHKCAAGTCGSYNTRVMQTFASQAEADAVGAPPSGNGAVGAQAARAPAAPQPQPGPRSPATSMGSPHSALSSSSSASPQRWR